MFLYHELLALAEIEKDKIIYARQRFMPLMSFGDTENFYSYLETVSHLLTEQIFDMIFPDTFPIEKIKWKLLTPEDLQGHDDHEWCAVMRQTILGE